jgi:hypothetical protein
MAAIKKSVTLLAVCTGISLSSLWTMGIMSAQVPADDAPQIETEGAAAPATEGSAAEGLAAEGSATSRRGRNNMSSDGIASLRRSTAYIMSLPQEQVIALVPKQSRGINWTTCPHCRKRTRSAVWQWSVQRPNKVTCSDCKTTFPNPEYPQDKFLEIDAPGGKHRFAYFEETFKGKTVRRFFSATADFRAKDYMARQADDLAKLYTLTGDEKYARRAYIILAEFARVFPGYAFVVDGEWRDVPVVFEPYNSKRVLAGNPDPSYRITRWSYWAFMDISRDIVGAYASLASWPGLKTPEGQRTARAIEEDLIGEQIKHVLRFPEEYQSNMSISSKWPGLFHAARVIKKPELFHATMRSVERFLDGTFLYDGSWWETSPSYARQITSGGLRNIPAAANGYSDPPGYIDAISGKRYDNLNLDSQPEFIRANLVLSGTRLPDGRLLPLNDTWPTARLPETRENVKSALFPGFGVGLLGGGQAEKQLYSYLNFTGGTSHKHKDALSMGLFANGKELFPDVGYTHSRYKPWAISTMSHNTVVVNGRESEFDRDYNGNRLRSYVTDGSLFHLTSAESTSAYLGIAEKYQRTLALIGSDSSNSYLIDIFDVRGGKQHDYLLHGSYDEDSVPVVEGTRLAAYQGTLLNPDAKFVPPTSERSNLGGPEGAYGFVKNLQRGSSTGAKTVLTFQLKKSPTIGTRSTLLTGAGDNVFIGTAPSIRRIGGAHLRENEALLDTFHAPMLAWRRQGDNLQSHFVAIHETLPTSIPVVSVEQTDLQGRGILLRIDRGDAGVDYFVKSYMSGAALTATTPDGPLAFTGDYGFVRSQGGSVKEARLVGQGHIQLGAYRLEENSGTYRGKVVNVKHNDSATSGGYFDVDAALPTGAPYAAFHINFPDGTERAYNVLKVEAQPGNTSRVYVHEKAGFEVAADKIELISYPQSTIKGTQISFSVTTLKKDSR